VTSLLAYFAYLALSNYQVETLKYSPIVAYSAAHFYLLVISVLGIVFLLDMCRVLFEKILKKNKSQSLRRYMTFIYNFITQKKSDKV
jgi:hypothetical protein